MATLSLSLRSALYLLLVCVITVTHATTILLLFWLPTRWLQKIVTSWCAINLYFIKHIYILSYEVKGLTHLKKAIQEHGGVVLMSKHQSTFETMIFQVILKSEPAIVLKKELLNIPFYGWALARMKPIAIDRKDKSSAMEQVVNRGTEALKAGRMVLIFPEGTRTPYGKATRVKKGGINLALNADAPIIPVALNTGKYWPRGSLFKQPGMATLSFGEPIKVEGKSVEQLQAEIQTWIDTEIKQFD